MLIVGKEEPYIQIVPAAWRDENWLKLTSIKNEVINREGMARKKLKVNQIYVYLTEVHAVFKTINASIPEL